MSVSVFRVRRFCSFGHGERTPTRIILYLVPACPGYGVFVRLGFFGGTFNPIHLGHLRAAVEVRESFSLDRLLLIPSANPPHKISGNVADAGDRLEMVRLAIHGMPLFEVSDVELTRPGLSYTIETLRYFQDRFGHETDIHFIVGQDAFSEITTWKSYLSLFSTAHFIVMTRPGSKLHNLKDFIHAQISSEYQYEPLYNRYIHPDWCTIFCLDITHLDISATRIREYVQHGLSVRYLVPDVIEDYIVKKGLYL